jgi:CxxC motif-containing protein
VTTEREITCIVCPLGCKILVRSDGTTVETLKGNKCNKGVDYARNEVFDPRRLLTTSLLVKHGEWPLVSVKSSQPVPKEKIFSLLKELRKTTIGAPVKSGQILIKNAANIGVDILATKTVKKSRKTLTVSPKKNR